MNLIHCQTLPYNVRAFSDIRGEYEKSPKARKS